MRISRFSFLSMTWKIFIKKGINILRILKFALRLGRCGQYLKFYRCLDDAVLKFKTRDASGFAVLGFPYLRANRFLVGVAKKANTHQQKKLWIELMRDLDVELRKREIKNLPDEAISYLSKKLGQPVNKNKLQEFLFSYSQELLESDLDQTDFFTAVMAAVIDPGEYSFLMRLLGFYPAAYIAVSRATDKAYKEFRTWHEKTLSDHEQRGQVKTFGPVTENKSSFEDISRIYKTKKLNELGMPYFGNDEMRNIAFGLAPILSIDIVDDYDKFGEVVWKDGRVNINTANPVVYYYFSYGAIKQEPVLQVNYAFWYPGRLGPNAPWMEKGALDGMTLRITLDNEGLPIMADVMNNCGCYYFYVPRKEAVKKIIKKPFQLEPFVPAWLPDGFPKKKIALRINTGWHQVQHIDATDVEEHEQGYQLLPYEVLEQLPKETNKSESVFNPAGIMKDSQRIEPYIFFSMGIPKVGFMRQRGNHAIKMVGRAHFTDYDSYDRDFIF